MRFRSRRFVALAGAATTALFALVGCGSGGDVVQRSSANGRPTTDVITAATLFAPPPPPVDAPAAGATGAALRAAVPGLYVPDSLDARALPTGAVSVHRSGPCSGLRDILLAGDWALSSELVVPEAAAQLAVIAGFAPQILLRQGSDRAFALLSDGTDGCDATIGRAASGTVSVQAGAASATGAGWAVTSSCIDIAGSLTFSAVIGLSDGSVSAMVQAVVDAPAEGAAPDTARTVSSSDSGDTFVTTDPRGVLGLFSELLALSAAGDSNDLPPGFDPAALITLESADDPIGVATVDAAGGHIRGTVQLTGLATSTDDGEGGVAATIAFPFDCPTVVEFSG